MRLRRTITLEQFARSHRSCVNDWARRSADPTTDHLNEVRGHAEASLAHSTDDTPPVGMVYCVIR